MPDSRKDPTKIAYTSLRQAYDFFNRQLFGNSLPHCLITMHKKGNSYGYFAFRKFGTLDGGEVTDEICLNPKRFLKGELRDSLSTLVHEMVHLQQYHFGKPSRRGYHNKQWGVMMDAVGLTPSDSGRPGGKRTGQRMSHYIVDDGSYDIACAKFLKAGVDFYADIWPEGERRERRLKTKYTCPDCGLNAWAKPNAELDCHKCGLLMIAEDDDSAPPLPADDPPGTPHWG